MESKRGGGDTVDVGAFDLGRQPVAHGEYFVHLAGQEPGEIQDVRGLLHHRAA